MRRSKLITITVICAALAILLFVGGVLAWYFLSKGDVKPCPEGAHKFNYWEIETRATCGVAGTEVSTCTVCGEKGTRSIAPTGRHDFGDWEMVTLATLTSGGEARRTCENCGTVERDASIPAFGLGSKVTVSGSAITLTLSDYRIVYNGSGVIASAADAFAGKLLSKTGAALSVKDQASVPSGGTAAEILIGSTNRTETQTALSGITGEGFAVRLIGNKLVIVGTSEMQTLAALQYFTHSYLAGTTASLSVKESAVLSSGTSLAVITTGGSPFRVVFDKHLDNNPTHAYVSSSTSDARDYPCRAAQALTEDIVKIAKADSAIGEIAAPTWSADDRGGEYEISFGTTDRPIAKSFLALLDGNEYGILVTENAVYLIAHNDYALAVCKEKFLELLGASVGKDVHGNPIYQLPVGFCLIEPADKNWITDFPRPTGANISLHSSLYVNQGALQYLYTGAGVNATAFENYRAALVAAGYTIVTEHTMEGSRFLTAKHVAKNVMLNLGYNAFSHAGEDHNTDDATHRTKYPYLNYEAAFRIVVAPLDGSYMPDESLFFPQAYDKVTESSVTTVRVQDAVGHSFVITLEDGSFIVIDGGSNTAEAKNNLWNTLSALHKKIWGVTPSKTKPVVVRAWYLTHSHGDHYNAFRRLVEAHKDIGDFKVEYLYGNFPEKTVLNGVASDTVWASNNLAYLEGLGMRYQRVWTGQVIYFANVKLEVLMTYADHAPRRIDNSNDSNTMTRITFQYDKPQSVEKTTMLILGDACVYQSRFLCAMYGSALQSDMVQFAHHGNIGCEIALYKLASPTVIWYTHSSAGYNNYVSSSNSTWTGSVTDYVVNKLESVKYIYVSGCKGVSGTEALTLHFKADGKLDYGNIYNPITGVKYTYITDSVYASPSPAIQLR